MIKSTKASHWIGGAVLGTALAFAAPAVSDASDSLLAQGDSNDSVSEAQSVLDDKGYYDYEVDGVFGSITAAAVRDFQADEGLTVDGVIGPNTKAALYGESSSSSSENNTEESSEADDSDNEAVESASTSEGSSSEDTSGGESMTVEATAYTAACAGCSGITATGVNLNTNRNAKVIAVDPDVIPLGSEVQIEGMGTYTAADTGGAINGNRIDVHVPSKSEAYSFGRRSVEVTVVD
ncbi:3D (Asp-Asp-Asp) domain-containing protein [Marinococcus luteus]|uniref:3D (Asp-Asp-Asp) domain-containing protein n=1 Tax=Marinococcus luteus TaxID=1122204 RepID=A0A1H2RW21_9BACI|nr:3D domain-containing protein [Marinococcus luteus]SDW23498.1 3D (Asp-Asp-Asp) domain-containing protein [Marinococcus luteus]